MAHDPSRTEQATPKRRHRAREEGTVLRVQDLDATILLWGNLLLFLFTWSSTVALMTRQVAHFFVQAGSHTGMAEQDWFALGWDMGRVMGQVLLPFLGANLLIALVNQFVQHGFHITFKPLSPKFEKLNPFPGFKRIISARSGVEIVKSLGKFAVVVWIAYLVLAPKVPAILNTMVLPLNESMTFLQQTLFILYRNVMLAMLVLALADFLYQRHNYEKNLRMTKQEVKDEMKEAEGNPEIKGKQRNLMFSSVMRRIMAQVPKASVVITNPTHVAVALRYDPETFAPICVAKGLDHLALKIKERAKSSGVPIVENPPLARTLYKSVELDRPIPPELYQAVAQVLAFVYRIKGVA